MHCTINGQKCQWKNNMSQINCKNCPYLLLIDKETEGRPVKGFYSRNVILKNVD